MLQKSLVIVALVVPLVVCSPLAALHELLREQETFVSPHAEGEVKSVGGPPQDLSAVPLSSTQLNVSWSPPDFKPLYYGVRVSSPYLDEVTFDTFYVINGLGPCSSYMVEVSSVYDDGRYPDTTSGKTDSDVPPPPPSCRIRDVTSTSMRVTWAVPSTSCQIVNYSLSWTYDVLWSEEQGSDQIITPGTEVSIKNLIPWTNYTYSIAAATDAGYGKPLLCPETTLEDIPGLVNITDVTFSDASATIYWLPPDPANGVTTWYHVNVVDDDGNGHPKQFSGSVLKGTMDADDGLEPCVSYTVSIQAENSAGSGPLNSYDEPFIMYFDVPVESVDCSMDKWTMEVCWVPNSVSCPVSRYILNWTSEVLWSGESDIGIIGVPGDTTDLCQQRDSLTPYATYTVCVNVGEDTSGECCSKRTDPAAPSAPYLKELAVDGVSLTASWDEPEQKNGILNGYSLTWTDSQGTVKGQSVDNSTLSFTIKDLEWCETYTVVVQAETVGGGFGPNSNERTSTSCGPPQNLTALPLSDTQLSVTWSASSFSYPPLYYRVQVSSLYIDEITYNTYYVLHGLQPCTSYTVQVISVCECGDVGSATTSGSTVVTEPPPPHFCSITNVTSTTMHLEWAAPDTNCPIYMYNVSWTYDVLWSEEQDDEWILVTEQTHSGTDLIPYTYYTYSIAASAGAGYGLPITCSAITEEDAPSDPYLEELEIGPESLTATWTEPMEINGILSAYRLTWEDGEDNVAGSITLPSTTQSFTFADQGCGDYSVMVQAETVSGGWGDYSNSRSTNISSLSELWCDGEESREASISWNVNRGECVVTNYTLEWYTTCLWNTSASSDRGLVELDGSVTSYTLTDLQPYTEVHFCLRMEDGSGQSFCCNTTTSEEAPGPVRMEGVLVLADSATATVTWLPPLAANGRITLYQITLTSAEGQQISNQVSGDSLETDVWGLVACQQYTVHAKASTSVGWGPSTSFLTFSILSQECDTFDQHPITHLKDWWRSLWSA